ncbi:unnamed protein product [Amoebophrya sp. A120]|nr:unnamed protein product [Amoebophrya sp. A120]|eukprot:GSA120T00003926001.1
MKCRGKKNTSKRKSLSLQHKITKKATEKKRKLRKEARKAVKNGVQIKRKKQKMTVPALWPFKQEELAFLKQRQERREAEQQKQKELNQKKKKELQKKKRKEALKAPARPVNTLENVLDTADLVIEVVDARDPFATRCLSIEKDESKKNKIIVLTKGDLVPMENLQQWLHYLRRTTPDNIPVLSLMKRASNEEASKLIRDLSSGEQQQPGSSTSSRSTRNKFLRPVGFKQLIALLSKGYSASKNIAVVGYPGVGKHTVVSYLKSPQMNLSKKVKIQTANIIDFKTEDEVVDGNQNIVDLLFTQKPQASKQPLTVLKRLLERTLSKEDLQIKLALPQFEDAKTLMTKMQRDHNLPGIIDAGRFILKRMNAMFYFTSSPKLGGASEQAIQTPKNVVKQDLEAIYAEQEKEIQACAGLWGRTTPTTGLVSEASQAVQTASDLSGTGQSSVDLHKALHHSKGKNLGKTEYFELKCPVSICPKTGEESLMIGGPEPFSALEFGTPAAKEEDEESIQEASMEAVSDEEGWSEVEEEEEEELDTDEEMED